MAASNYASGTVRLLALELKNLQDNPFEGIQSRLFNENNIFEWEVALFGPPDTLYQGGYYKAIMKFPPDYPFSPPSVRFITKVWHPNVYENGDMCISILHPPKDDPQSGELPCERWNPTQNVRTILISVVSLLNEPNTSSPANVDASVMYNRWKRSNGEDKEYERIIRKQMEVSRVDAEREGIVIPTTREEYCKTVENPDQRVQEDLDKDNFYDDEFDLADYYADDEYDCSSATSSYSEDHVSDSCDNAN